MEQFAKIYLDSPLSFEDLVHAIQRLVGGSVSIRTIEGGPIEIDVLKNGDHDAERTEAGDCIHFPYVLEAFPNGDMEDRHFISAAGRLVEELAGKGWQFATTADFEEQLPFEGRKVGRSG